MYLLSLILSVFLRIAIPAYLDQPEVNIGPVVSALENGSSSELARFFDTSISMNVNGQQGEYSKNQAEIVLRVFIKISQTGSQFRIYSLDFVKS